MTSPDGWDPGVTPPDGIVDLLDAAALDRRRVGGKAAVLSRLARAGFAVPDGWVLPWRDWADRTEPERRALLAWLAARLDGDGVAVRSSAVAEDGHSASFAGMFDTVLDVDPANLGAAVHQCFEAVSDQRVVEYRRRIGSDDDVQMSVVVQRMVAAEIAGVAFSTDPLTGDRSVATVSATRGLGEGVVEGRTVEEWRLAAGGATCRLSHGVLSADDVTAIGALLTAVQIELGADIDLEWARHDGRLVVLQARPVTALPPAVRWSVPHRGLWLRHIRLGEWLPEPVTPLFDTWVLARIEEGFRRRQRVDAGFLTPGVSHVLVNGWYFHSPVGTGDSRLMLAGMARRPLFAAGVLLASMQPVAADRLAYGRLRERAVQHWVPRYTALVDRESDRVADLPVLDLGRVVDELCGAAADVAWALVMIGGAAWRSESALLRHLRTHLGPAVAAQSGRLLARPNVVPLAAHSSFSLDFFRPTLGETGALSEPTVRPTRSAEVLAARTELEMRVLRALDRRVRRRFLALLAVARQHAATRDDLSATLTYGWPLLRQIAHRWGANLQSEGVLGRTEQIFFLSRSEVVAALSEPRAASLSVRSEERRALWESRRLLTPPLSIGSPSYFVRRLLPAARQRDGEVPAGALAGVPASPGVGVGPVRVLRDPTDVGDVRAGEVLVVVATPPAITSAFSRIAGLCVDGGSVAAHASIVAREFAIPTVVGLGDATSRLQPGVQVVVDGTAGHVRPLYPRAGKSWSYSSRLR